MRVGPRARSKSMTSSMWARSSQTSDAIVRLSVRSVSSPERPRSCSASR
jgi:hypothetical protein